MERLIVEQYLSVPPVGTNTIIPTFPSTAILMYKVNARRFAFCLLAGRSPKKITAPKPKHQRLISFTNAVHDWKDQAVMTAKRTDSAKEEETTKRKRRRGRRRQRRRTRKTLNRHKPLIWRMEETRDACMATSTW
jgi:hypothetical protein